MPSSFNRVFPGLLPVLLAVLPVDVTRGTETVAPLPAVFTEVDLPGQPIDESAAWIVRADALLLWRTAPHAQPLFDTWDPGTSTATGPALNTDQLGSGMAAGPRISLLRQETDRVGWELAWFRVESFAGKQSLPTSVGGYAIARETSIYGNTWDGLDSVETRLSSSIQSLEVLGRLPSQAGRLHWTAGFRWVEWQENLGIVTPYTGESAPGVFEEFVDLYGTSTINSLYGMQLGADAAIWRPGNHFRVDGLAKAGLYGNNARQTSQYVTNDPDFPFAGSVATSTGRLAFVGEVGATAVWQMTDRVAARVGWMALWLGGLATASGQLPEQTLVDGQPTSGATNTGGSVFLQGISLGLEAIW